VRRRAVDHPARRFDAANGLAYVLDSFTYRGQVPLQQILNSDDFLSGKFFGDKSATGQPRRNERPLNLDIIDFPS
jgi:hypothetical protein